MATPSEKNGSMQPSSLGIKTIRERLRGNVYNGPTTDAFGDQVYLTQKVGPLDFVCLFQDAMASIQPHLWYILAKRNEP